MITLRHVMSLALWLGGASLAHAQAAPAATPTPAEAAPTTQADPSLEPGAPLTVNPGAAIEQPLPSAAPPAEATPTTAQSGTGSSSAWDYLDQGAADDPNAPAATPEELAALTGPGEQEEERFPKLDLYGFADFTYWQPLLDNDSSWSFFYPNKSTFFVGNINLYVASQMSRTLRSLIEVRFTYLPQGKNRSGNEQLGQPYTETRASDYTDGERPIRLGAIEIERVHLTYAPVEWFSITTGQWLTPYGIWNVDHGSPTTIDSHRPFVIGEQYFPERQTGFLLQGALRRGIHRVAYNLGLSNGRGPLDSYNDFDNNKAVTLALSWTSNSVVGDVTLGVSGYTGRYTDLQKSLQLTPTSGGGILIKGGEDINEQYDELTLGADVKWIKGGFQTFAEAILNQRRYTKAGRPPLQLSSLDLFEPLPQKRVQPDSQRYGGYVISGYRFRWLGVMPFAQVEYVRLGAPDLPQTTALTLGLNIRPHESVTLKTHWAYAWFPGADERGIGRDGIQVFENQVAWAF